MRLLSLLLISVLFFSCQNRKQSVNLLVHNAKVYTVNENFATKEAFVVNEGRILETGSTKSLEEKYSASKTLDAEGHTIVPGLIDAHAHLYGLGLGYQNVDLVGTESKEEVLDKLVNFEKDRNSTFILGRGWDQNDWKEIEFPTKEDLDYYFPDIPVALSRIDGHALWVNSKTLELAGITKDTQVPGGEVILKNGEPSGILIDGPTDLVYSIMPPPSKETKIQALLDAEKTCLALGLTTIDDAGLERDVIELIDSLQQEGIMKLRVYAMIANDSSNLDYYLRKGSVKTDRLNVCSVKVYADGALGSRGATLKKPYSDQHGHYGAMITTENDLRELAKKIAEAGYQMNTHAIGDSATISVLRAYEEALRGKEDARWRVEHAQIVAEEDFAYFSKNIIPSVQPTHATSDMYWAEDRVGPDRMKGSYAYKTLLDEAGIVALGTDFPVENVNPMYTFYAAVARKDLEHYPEDGFQIKEALSREEALKGMTIWAAYANFEEDEKGSIEPGKFADFTILDTDLLNCPENELPKIKVLGTYINGEKVFGL